MSKKPETLNADEQVIEATQTASELMPVTDLSVQLDEVSKVYGDNLPYNRNQVIGEVKFLMNQTTEGMLEMGKRLVMLKENEPHGEFMKIIEKDFNLSKSTAQRMMQASVKFLNIKNPNYPALGNLGKAKLFELMTQDDEDLEELAEGGTVAGLTLDEIDKMTTRELKAALREAKDSADNLRRISADKEEKIVDLCLKLKKDEKSRKKLDLKVDESAELLVAYKDRWLEISKQLYVNLCDSKAIINKALDEALPEHFLKQVAIELSDISREFLDLLDYLPSDTTPLNLADKDWDIDPAEVYGDKN